MISPVLYIHNVEWHHVSMLKGACYQDRLLKLDALLLVSVIVNWCIPLIIPVMKIKVLFKDNSVVLQHGPFPHILSHYSIIHWFWIHFILQLTWHWKTTQVVNKQNLPLILFCTETHTNSTDNTKHVDNMGLRKR